MRTSDGVEYRVRPIRPDDAQREREFIAANAFTPADIVVGCAAHRWLNLPLAREPRPNLERWYAEVSSRPSVKA